MVQVAKTGKVFLSYRREDTSAMAGRLAERIRRRYPRAQVFMDVDDMKLGEDYGAVILREVPTSDVLIALIGTHWLDAADGDGQQRLANKHDWVRREVRVALKHRVQVIPVLVNGAEMPTGADLPKSLSDLARRNAAHLRGVSFSNDVKPLLDRIGEVLHAPPEPPEPPPEPPPPDVGRGGGTRRPAVPVHRSVFLVLLWVVSLLLTLLFSVGMGLALAGKLQSLGGSVSAAIAVCGLLTALVLAALWRESTDQRRMISEAAPAGRAPTGRFFAVLAAAAPVGFLALGGLALLWFLLARLL